MHPESPDSVVIHGDPKALLIGRATDAGAGFWPHSQGSPDLAMCDVRLVEAQSGIHHDPKKLFKPFKTYSFESK